MEITHENKEGLHITSDSPDVDEKRPHAMLARDVVEATPFALSILDMGPTLEEQILEELKLTNKQLAQLVAHISNL